MNINEAMNMAFEKHIIQKDKNGISFFWHPYEVMCMLGTDSSDDEKMVAILHDIIEDTDISLKCLKDLGVEDHILNSLSLLSRDKDDEKSYLEWIENIANSGDIIAIKVKYCDNLHNSLPWRIKKLPEKERDIIKRYKKSMEILFNAYIKLEDKNNDF